MLNVVWFKKDLRVHDNPALFHAMESGPTLAIYCVSDWQWNKHNVSCSQRALIKHHLISLQQSLAALNVPLIILASTDFSNTKDSLVAFLTEHSATAFYFNKQYEWDEKTLENKIQQSVIALDIQVLSYDDQCIHAPGTIVNQSGECFKVFTAFKRKYYAQEHSVRSLYPAPSPQDPIGLASDMSVLMSGSMSQSMADPLSLSQDWLTSEASVLDALERFADGGMIHYQDRRNLPAISGTSCLSPYLAIGAMSTRQCMQTAQLMRTSLTGDLIKGAQCWMDELVWRDFYRHLLFFFPKLSKHQAFDERTDQLPWGKDDLAFKTWCEGLTGFPIVDAGMRQLKQEGWMHNRVRMIVAMFFTKHLFMDWRLGEAYFHSMLIDCDLASNNGGWQWCASTGVDAAPYFRVFNPVLQSQRFDADGDYIRRYVSELSTLDNKSIHFPSNVQREQLGYPDPMVDHKTAVSEIKSQFKALRHTNHEIQTNLQTQGELGL